MTVSPVAESPIQGGEVMIDGGVIVLDERSGI